MSERFSREGVSAHVRGDPASDFSLPQLRVVVASPGNEDLAVEGRLLVVQEGPVPDVPVVFAVVAREAPGITAPPPELGGDTLTELLTSKKVRFEIDPKYPQAIGIGSILSLAIKFGNFKWDILINLFDDSPFFTSDFPVAIEKTDDPRILNRIAPLSPNLAIRIHPDFSLAEGPPEFSFSGFRSTTRQISRQEVININRHIIRCAETTVFFRDNHEWVPKFVKKNAAFRIEPRTHKIPYGNGKLLRSTLEIIKTRGGANGT